MFTVVRPAPTPVELVFYTKTARLPAWSSSKRELQAHDAGDSWFPHTRDFERVANVPWLDKTDVTEIHKIGTLGELFASLLRVSHADLTAEGIRSVNFSPGRAPRSVGRLTIIGHGSGSGVALTSRILNDDDEGSESPRAPHLAANVAFGPPLFTAGNAPNHDEAELRATIFGGQELGSEALRWLNGPSDPDWDATFGAATMPTGTAEEKKQRAEECFNIVSLGPAVREMCRKMFHSTKGEICLFCCKGGSNQPLLDDMAKTFGVPVHGDSKEIRYLLTRKGTSIEGVQTANTKKSTKIIIHDDDPLHPTPAPPPPKFGLGYPVSPDLDPAVQEEHRGKHITYDRKAKP